MKKLAILGVVALVLVVVVSSAACTEEPSAQEIVDGVVESLDEMRTYEFEMDMTGGLTAEAEGETYEATTAVNLDGVVDLENRQMKLGMTVTVEGLPGQDKLETTMETYLVGDMIYIMLSRPEMGPEWMKLEMPEGYWGEMNQVESQIGLLEAAQVEAIGSETIEGSDCYVLELSPDMEQLWQLAMEQGGLPGEEVPDVAEESLQEMFSSVSVKQWIAKDTYFLTKAEIDMVFVSAELTAEALGLEVGVSLPTDISIVLVSHNYNQPVSIVLPPEAEEAEEVPIE